MLLALDSVRRLVIKMKQCNQLFVHGMWSASEQVSRSVSHQLTRYKSNYGAVFTSLEQNRFLSKVHWKSAPNVTGTHLWSNCFLLSLNIVFFCILVLHNYQFLIESWGAKSQKSITCNALVSVSNNENMDIWGLMRNTWALISPPLFSLV